MTSIKLNSQNKNLNKNNIMIKKNGMYFCHQLINNSKNPSCKWKEHNNQKKISLTLNNEKNIANFGVVCGRRNNLCVIDIDCSKEENMNDNIFIQTFGDAENWFKLWNCPVVKTRSGGFHLYFQENPRVLQTANSETHIDIRAEGGYVVAPGSVVGDGKYEIIQGDIGRLPEMSETLTQFLEINYIGSKNSKKDKPKTRIKIIKSKDGKEIKIEEVIGADQSLYNYNYSDHMLNNIINGLPDEYFNDYHYWLIFTTAMKQIDRQDLWEEHSEKRGQKEYNIINNQDIWDGIKGHKTILAFNHILINSTYKNARTTLDYYKYKELLPNKISPHRVINRRKLGINENDEQEDYFHELVSECKKLIFIKSDTGTGKSTAFKRYIKNSDRKFLSIVSRRTLGQEQYNVFNKDGIDCKYYEYDRFEGGSYILQVDSIMKLRYAHEREGWFRDYDLNFDEFNSLIKHLFTSATLNKVRIVVMELLISIIKDCNQIWMTDADISDNSILFMKNNIDNFDENSLFILNEYKHNNNKIAEELFSYDDIMNKIKEVDECIIPCDEARTCHLIENEIKKHENKKDKKIVVIDRLTDEEILSDFNMDEWDIVIFSPKVIYGLDSVRSRPVFAVYKETTIDAGDMVQQINRCRNITKLWFYFERKTCYDCEYNTFKDCVDDTNDIKKWCEKNDHLHQDFLNPGINKMYVDIFNRFKYNQDSYSTNPSAHFRRIIKERGFKINTHICQSKKIETKLREDKKRRIEDITPELKFVQEQNKFLHLSDSEIMEHREVFLESQFITQLINSKLFLFDEFGKRYNPKLKKWIDEYEGEDMNIEDRHKDFIEKLKLDVNNSDDFSVKKIRSSKNKMLFINKVREAVKQPNKFSIQDFSLVDNDTAQELWSEYLSTFSSKSKNEENPFLTEKGIQGIMVKMYKNLFGMAPFEGKEMKSTVNGVRVSEYIYKDNYENKKFVRMKDIYFKGRENRKKEMEENYKKEMEGYGFSSDEE
jgi:hypothetical protein